MQRQLESDLASARLALAQRVDIADAVATAAAREAQAGLSQSHTACWRSSCAATPSGSAPQTAQWRTRMRGSVVETGARAATTEQQTQWAPPVS